MIQSLSELPEYRQVLLNLIARDLKVKYQKSILGFFWTLLYPAFMLGIYVVIFGLVLSNGIENFWAYLIAGLLPFQFIMSSVLEGAAAIRTNGNLIRKIYFPAEILVIATVTAKLIEFLLQLLVAMLFLVLWHHGQTAQFSPVKTLLVLPGAIFLLYCFALGLALPLAAWSVIYRDLEHILGLMMTAWFYVTPIFWSLALAIEHLPRTYEWFLLNPALNLLELFRSPLYWGTYPLNHAAPNTGSAEAWALAALPAAISLIGGYWIFNRSKRVLAEVV